MVDQGRENIMFAINKKEAPIGTQQLFKKADQSNRLRQNHLNPEASFTPNDIIGIIFLKLGANYQIWSRLSEVNFF